jgi:hypothetical protein
VRYFTRGWANGELTDEEEQAVSRAYEARLAEIAPHLSPSTTRLCGGVSLHDAIVESVRWTPSLAELRLELVGGTSEAGYQAIHLTYRGTMLGKARIDSLRNVACNREACVLYQEVDIPEDGLATSRSPHSTRSSASSMTSNASEAPNKLLTQTAAPRRDPDPAQLSSTVMH